MSSIAEVVPFPYSTGVHFLRTSVTGKTLHDASRRAGAGIITEGVHFFATQGGYYFIDRQCFAIARDVLEEIKDDTA